jgi:DNA-binding transcriptional regulator YiaG
MWFHEGDAMLMTVDRKPKVYSRGTTATEQVFYNDLMQELRAKRIELGITQRVLSEQLGVAENLVSKWEVGMRAPSAFFLMLWCSRLGVVLCLKPVSR